LKICIIEDKNMTHPILNPFICGKPVPPHRFVGRTDAVRRIFSRINNSESTAVVGEPHIGKSSLLGYVADDKIRSNWLRNVADNCLFDPELTLTCPAEITASCGMDALSQLIESYLSTNASPLTDALALSGLQYTKDNLVAACFEGAKDVNVRSAMAYASLISGITLANAGLGVIHGIASSIGGYFDIAHGVVCGTLVEAANRINIEKLRQTGDSVYLKKYAAVGALLTGCDSKDVEECCNQLIKTLGLWVDRLNLPRLSKYGITERDLDKIVDGSGNKQNPVILSKSEIREILLLRL
jgi:alcohol dehydrogenase class IV